MNKTLQGTIVLITGGAGGIGSATAILLAQRGASIAIADIRESAAQELALHITQDGGTAKAYGVDVTNVKAVQSLVEAVVTDFGKLDVLINSAGVMLIRPMTETNIEEWNTTIDLNLKGTLWQIAAALPVFEKQGSGHFINLGSVHGLKVFSPGGAVHSASKFAVRAIAEGLRVEVGSAIRVTTISPGAVDTGIQNKTQGTDSERIREIYKKALPAGAVANAIAFAIEQPSEVDVNEIVLRPTAQVI